MLSLLRPFCLESFGSRSFVDCIAQMKYHLPEGVRLWACQTDKNEWTNSLLLAWPQSPYTEQSSPFCPTCSSSMSFFAQIACWLPCKCCSVTFWGTARTDGRALINEKRRSAWTFIFRAYDVNIFAAQGRWVPWILVELAIGSWNNFSLLKFSIVLMYKEREIVDKKERECGCFLKAVP